MQELDLRNFRAELSLYVMLVQIVRCVYNSQLIPNPVYLLLETLRHCINNLGLCT